MRQNPFRLIEPTYSVIWAGETHAAWLRTVVPRPYVCVANRTELTWQLSNPRACALFIDAPLLLHLDSDRPTIPVIAVTEEDPSHALHATVKLLVDRPWLSHTLSTRLLAVPTARQHVAMLLDRLSARFADGSTRTPLGPTGKGRVALLAQASRRDARFDRIDAYFANQGLSNRTRDALHEIAEELVMNALYDAPVEAGYFPRAVPRTEDVSLPADRACEITYGMDESSAFVRVRDPFGAFTRARLLEVLARCATKDVSLDESRGGAGLGIWRVFQAASTISITVVPGKLTDIFVAITVKDGRATRELVATHLFFAPDERQPDAPLADDDLFDHSITLVGAVAI